jgi:hypothetical protein
MRIQPVMGRVVQPTDASTAPMLTDFLQTSHFASGELEIGQPPFDQPAQQYSFVDIYPTAVHVTPTGAQGTGPTEEVTFNYRQFTTMVGADSFCWSFAINHSC